jgi:hypothetical protein
MAAPTFTYTGTTNATDMTTAAQAKDPTRLELQISHLSSLVATLNDAVTRAVKTADRIVGCEPAQISKAESAPAPNDPPLMYQLEALLTLGHKSVEQLHHHLERLEVL